MKAKSGGRVRNFTPDEKKIMLPVIEQYLDAKEVGGEVMTLLTQDVNELNSNAGLLPRSISSVQGFFYNTRKKLKKQGVGKKPLTPVQVQPYVDSVSAAFKQVREAMTFLKTELDRLKTVEKENSDLKEKLRSLKDIRQAVENYQKIA